MKKKYHRLTLVDREEISKGLWADENFSQIAKRIGFDASAISREVYKNIKRKKRSYSAIKAQKRAALSPKARFPRGLSISEAGDMIQIDTKYIMLPGGGKYYQFTAIDVLTKKRVLRVSSSQSSRNGARFLEECILSFPFKIHRIQTDNGAPFMKEFDQLCREKDLPHYWTHPRSPQENTYVEISHGADEREFYQQGNISSILPTMQKRVREWEDIWNNVRPHQALGYLTPNQYFWKLKTSRLATKDVIILQT